MSWCNELPATSVIITDCNRVLPSGPEPKEAQEIVLFIHPLMLNYLWIWLLFIKMSYIKITTVSGRSFLIKTHSIFETIQGFLLSHISRIRILESFWNINQLLNIPKFENIQQFRTKRTFVIYRIMNRWNIFIFQNYIF